jgi:hypothetical protein
MNQFCNSLVEFHGQFVRRCNYQYLTEGQPLLVKIGFAIIILAGSLALSYVFFKMLRGEISRLKRIQGHRRWKDWKNCIYAAFLLLIFLSSAVLFIVNLIEGL